jgi:SH3-like domain-containing protein
MRNVLLSIPVIFLSGLVQVYAQQDVTLPNFPFLGEVKAERVNVRIKPSVSEDSTIVVISSFGEELGVVGQENGFYQILPPKGSSCWVSGYHLKRQGHDLGIITSDTELRSDSRTNAYVLGKISAGESVKILGEKYGWFKIEAPPIVRFWISKKYVRIKKEVSSLAQLEGLLGLAPVKIVEPPSSEGPDAVAASKDLEKLDRLAERFRQEREKLVMDRIEEADFSGILAELEGLLNQIKQGAVRKRVESMLKSVRPYHDITIALKNGILRVNEQLRRKLDELTGAKKKTYAFEGELDETGPFLVQRPGTHKLLKGGDILCFLKPKNKKIALGMRKMYKHYVGVNGKVSEIEEGWWKGYKVVEVEQIVCLSK